MRIFLPPTDLFEADKVLLSAIPINFTARLQDL